MNVEELRELIREDYYMINADETISKLFPLIEKLGKDKANAILVEEDREILGVVREKDLIRGRALKNPHETKVRSLLVKTGIIPISELTAEKVARRFIEDSTPFVVVEHNGKFGVIYINDFIKFIKYKFRGIKVRDLMNEEFTTVRRFDTVAKALSLMKKNGVDRVVVLDENGKVIGVLTGKDVIDRVISPRKRARSGDFSGEKEKSLSIMVESIMSAPPICAKANDSVSEVIDLMAENRISSIVVERDGIPEGILMKRDVLEFFLKSEEKSELSVQFIIQNITPDEFERDEIIKDIERFMRKYKDFLGETHVYVYLKKQRVHFRSLPLVSAKVKLWSAKGLFIASGESWGIEYAIHVALDKLEREVQKEKDLVEEGRLEKAVYEFFE
ncbi:MAG: CBS domain-containing protein [Archaeoglobaceae archaeon]|nr:CBS domain-containing protein [Archaeoglobaceae archaeon]MDW8117659.1 CBS domain-containing protein [Archaeoglobaceae archaeon]